ncbi:MAG: NTP transferase domain-containing protein [Chloroflexi bacterium]|nr:NTP transferase domain-containing protein [Chloroflexota bacterium]
MTEPKIVTIIQGRMASSRLPGKILEDLGGRPVLGWVVERARRAQRIDEVVVATTSDPSDDPVVEFCKTNGYQYYRGSMNDVLERYYQAAKEFNADVIVRLTADCPLIDSAMIDHTVETFLSTHPPLDFAANRLPMERTVPVGLDIEVCTFSALETAWQQADQPHQREHVMPYFYEHAERFNILHIKNDPDYGHLRWTVDTPEDLMLLRKLVSFFEGRDDFSWQEVLDLYENNPEWAEINAQVRHKEYREVDKRK